MATRFLAHKLCRERLRQRNSVWAQYTVRLPKQMRQMVQDALKEVGIPTAVHYPLPVHLQECFQYLAYKKGSFPIAEQVCNEVMSLPMNPFISENGVNYIARKFCMGLTDFTFKELTNK